MFDLYVTCWDLLLFIKFRPLNDAPSSGDYRVLSRQTNALITTKPSIKLRTAAVQQRSNPIG
jgi:hypothetical protein